jgi:hypothetical protein
MAGLMAGDRGFLFQDKDPVLGEPLSELIRRGQSNDSSADDRNIRVNHFRARIPETAITPA